MEADEQSEEESKHGSGPVKLSGLIRKPMSQESDGV